MPKSPKKRAEKMKRLINEGVALQVELLGAAVQVWSAIFESMASYTKTASQEFLQASAKGDANKALDNVITRRAPSSIRSSSCPRTSEGFPAKVKERARAKN